MVQNCAWSCSVVSRGDSFRYTCTCSAASSVFPLGPKSNLCNVHLDSLCVCTIYYVCMCCACTLVQPLEYISTTSSVSLSWLWEAKRTYPQYTPGAATVLQTTIAAVSIFANQPLTNRAGHPYSSIVAETLPPDGYMIKFCLCHPVIIPEYWL